AGRKKIFDTMCKLSPAEAEIFYVAGRYDTIGGGINKYHRKWLSIIERDLRVIDDFIMYHARLRYCWLPTLHRIRGPDTIPYSSIAQSQSNCRLPASQGDTHHRFGSCRSLRSPVQLLAISASASLAPC